MLWRWFCQRQILQLSLQMIGASELILGQIHLTSQGLCTARDKHVTHCSVWAVLKENMSTIRHKHLNTFSEASCSFGRFVFLGFLKFLEHLQRAKSSKKLTANIAYVHLWLNRSFWKHQFKMALVLACCFNYSAGQLLRTSFTGISKKELNNNNTRSTAHFVQGRDLQWQ